MVEKFSLRDITRTHHRSLSDGNNRAAYTIQYGPPLMVALTLIAIETAKPRWLDLSSETTATLLSTTGLLSAFLFGLAIVVLDKSIDLDLDGGSNPRRARRMLDISANASYASAMSAATTIVLVAAELVSSERIAILGLAGLSLIFTTGALVLRRVFAETKDRLIVGERSSV